MGIKITPDMLREIAEKYCEEHTPLSKLAKEYGVGKTTLVRYFHGQGMFTLDEELQARVDVVKQQNWIDGKATYGNLKFTDEEIITLANFMVDNQLTLAELGNVIGVEGSTLYSLFVKDKLGETLYNKVIMQYQTNKSNAFNKIGK